MTVWTFLLDRSNATCTTFPLGIRDRRDMWGRTRPGVETNFAKSTNCRDISEAGSRFQRCKQERW